MTERARTAIVTVLWCILVIAAVATLYLAAVNRNVVLVALAAIATLGVVKIHPYVPLPKVYSDQGITNDLFISRRQRLINEKKRNESAE